jgi:predicted ATPase
MISRQYAIDVQLRRKDVPSFDQYPFSLPAVRHLDVVKLHPCVTYFVGENGSGKSTLLEAIAVSCGFNAEGGTKNFRFGTRASHSELHKYLRIAKGVRRPKDGFFLRAESFFNVATEIERMDAEPAPAPPVIASYGGKSLHEQSHGESFLALMMNRFGGNGLYILDEPEAALSPQRQLAALARIHQLVHDDSQFIIATHSPILMAYPEAHIYHCSMNGLERVDYYATEHYQVMRNFISNPKRMLDGLFAPEDEG